MIDIMVINKAVKLKKEMDAAYLVFKKEPTVENSAKWTSSTRAYNDYCISTITKLVNEQIDSMTYVEDIIANFDKYSKCDKCGAELLFRTAEDKFVASSDFVESFPGWCYPCLVEHCANTKCEDCTVNTKPTCPFAEVKKLTAEGDA